MLANRQKNQVDSVYRFRITKRFSYLNQYLSKQPISLEPQLEPAWEHQDYKGSKPFQKPGAPYSESLGGNLLCEARRKRCKANSWAERRSCKVSDLLKAVWNTKDRIRFAVISTSLHRLIGSLDEAAIVELEPWPRIYLLACFEQVLKADSNLLGFSGAVRTASRMNDPTSGSCCMDLASLPFAVSLGDSRRNNSAIQTSICKSWQSS